MAKERVDAKKNQEKITKEVLSNPLQSQREIASNAGVWKTTVQEHLKNLPNTTKDDRILTLTDKDFELMQLIQKRKFERMNNTEQPVNDSDLNNWDKEAKARYTIFRWDVTDEKWGFKDMSAIERLDWLIGD